PAFEVALRLGALYAGIEQHEEVADALANYSEALGIAYQIRDDLSDLGSKGETNDITGLRPSLLLAVAYEKAKNDQKAQLESVWCRSPQASINPEQIEAVYTELKADERARLAPKLLGESTELVASFLRRQQNDDGGFKDRMSKSDLYYTVFGVEGLLALQAELPVTRIASYLKSFGSGEGLDFVHLCCLARAWTAIAGRSSTDSCGVDFRERILRRIEQFRSKDGGYSPVTGAKCGTAYGCFLALG